MAKTTLCNQLSFSSVKQVFSSKSLCSSIKKAPDVEDDWFFDSNIFACLTLYCLFVFVLQLGRPCYVG